MSDEKFENKVFEYLRDNLEFEDSRDYDGEIILTISLTSPNMGTKKWKVYTGLGLHE